MGQITTLVLWGKTWWKATTVQRGSKEFSWLSFLHKILFWGAGFSCFKEQHCPLPAPSCLSPMRKSLELSPCGAGRRLLLSLPAPWYLSWISAASMEEKHCWVFFASFLSKEVQEKSFFSTAGADRTSRNLSKGDWLKCPPAHCEWGTGSTSPTPADTAPRPAADTEGLCSAQRTDTMEASLHPDGLTCQCISASWPKARGDGFGIAKPQLFQQRQASTHPNTQNRNWRSGGGMKLTPARWAQSQELFPTIRV